MDKNRQVKNITVIGLGKLGICFALNLERAGFDVIGVDTNESRISQINEKTLESDEDQVTEMLQKSKNFKATLDFDHALKNSMHVMT